MLAKMQRYLGNEILYIPQRTVKTHQNELQPHIVLHTQKIESDTSQAEQCSASLLHINTERMEMERIR